MLSLGEAAVGSIRGAGPPAIRAGAIAAADGRGREPDKGFEPSFASLGEVAAIT